jgi:hypothetical protein
MRSSSPAGALLTLAGDLGGVLVARIASGTIEWTIRRTDAADDRWLASCDALRRAGIG